MNKLCRKGMGLLLALSLSILPGCGKLSTGGEAKLNQVETHKVKGETSETAKGKYIEDNPFGEEHYFLSQTPEGNVVGYTMGSLIRNKLSDTGEWKEELPQQQFIAPTDLYGIQKFFETEEGLIIAYTIEDGSLKIGKQKEGGKWETVALTNKGIGINIKAANAVLMELGKKDQLFLSTDFGPVGLYDLKTGKCEMEYPDQVYRFSVGEDCIYEVPLTEKTKKVNVYDLKTATLKETIELPMGTSGSICIKAGPAGDLYVLDMTGILHLPKGSSTWEQVVAPEGTVLAMGDVWPLEVYIQKDSFVVLFTGQQRSCIRRYSYSPDAEAIGQPEELNVYMLYNNSELRQAMALYQQEHPNVKFNVEFGEDQASDIGYEEMVKRLNTRLLAGEGPDLMMLDYLPVETYIQKGLLEDLTDIIKEVVEKDTFNNKVLETFKQGDCYYAVPMFYRTPLLLGNEKILNSVTTLEELAAYKKEHPNEVLLDLTTAELYMQLEESCSPSWFDEKGSFKKESFKAFLETITTLTEHEFKEEEKSNYCGRTDLEETKGKEVLDMAYRNTELVILTPRLPVDISLIQGAFKQRGEGTIRNLVGQSKDSSFMPKGILGVNANSQKQEIAKEIIKIALGEEIQSIGSVWGTSVNNTGAEKVKEACANWENELKDNSGRRIMTELNCQDLYNKYEACLEAATVSGYTSTIKCQGVVQSEAMKYCVGTQTLEDTLTNIEKALKLQGKSR